MSFSVFYSCEIGHLVFSYLNLNEMLNCLRVSKSWRHIASNPLFWQSLCLKNDIKIFDGIEYIVHSNTSRWKDIYFDSARVFKNLNEGKYCIKKYRVEIDSRDCITWYNK